MNWLLLVAFITVSCLLLFLLLRNRAAHRVLEKRAAELDTYFNTAVDLFCIADLQGRFMRLNPQWELTLGCPLQELTGRQFMEFVHPDDVRVTESAVATLAADRPVLNFVNRYRHRNGAWRWLEWRSFARDGVIYAAARDVTEREQAEAENRESTRRLNEAQAQAHLGHWELDLRTNRLVWSDETYRIFGLKLQEFAATYEAFLEVIHPDDRALVNTTYTESVRNRVPYLIVHRLRLRDGTIKHVRENCRTEYAPDGTPLRSLGTVQDVTERIKAQQAMVESEERYRGLFNSMTSGFALHEIILDADAVPCDYRFLEVNPAFERITGLKVAGLIGRRVLEVLPDTEKYWVETYGKVALGGPPVHFENYAAALDRWFAVSAYSPKPRQFAVIVDDITTRKQMEQALRESEQRIQHKLNELTAPEGGIEALDLGDIIDVPAIQNLMNLFHALTGLPIGIIDMAGKVLVGTGWQQACTEFHRRHPETLHNCLECDTVLTRDIPHGTFRAYRCKNGMVDLATPLVIGGRHLGNVFIGQFFYDDDPPDTAFFRAQAQRYGFDEQAYLDAIDRCPRFSRERIEQAIDFYMKLAHMFARLSLSNLTLVRTLEERRRAEQELERQRRLVETMLANLTVGIFMVEAPTGKPLIANDAARRLLGRGILPDASRENIGEVYKAFRAADGVPYPVDDMPVIRAMQGDESAVDDMLVVRPDGTRTHLEVFGTPVRDADGTVVAALVSFHDITERKRAEQELRDKNEELERFTYTVSHDLKSPLTTIKGFAGAIAQDLAAGRQDRVGRDLQRIEAAADKMANLIYDLLELSRIGRMINRPETVPLGVLVDEVRTLLAGPLAAKQVLLEVAPDLPEVTGDRPRLRSVLQNLVENAIKYMGTQAQPRISVGWRRRGADYEFSVADNGMGIEPRHQGKVFGLFDKLDPNTEGTGIGLTVVRRIVEAHGGAVRLESAGAGQGCTFHFTLPENLRTEENC